MKTPLLRTILGGLAGLLLIFVLKLFTGNEMADAEGTRVIGFYNVENLFDTNHDEGKSDEDFLPDGRYEWTEEKYQKKVANIASVIEAMAEKNGAYHTVLGLAEVENRHVLDDLVSSKAILDAEYSIVHYESTDGRGIDVALLYRPSEFKLIDSKKISYARGTRDALMARGTIDGEMFAFFVAHLPSRQDEKNAQLRMKGARTIKNEALTLQQEFPGIKIVIMGDMNDNPGDESMVEGLSSFYDPFLEMHEDGLGSEEYHGEWNLFDIIMVNDALKDQDAEGYKLQRGPDGYWGYIFNPDFLTQQSGRFKGTPLRTFSGSKFLDGYSDHYPTYIKISR